MEPGLLVAYVALLALAVFPIYIGSWDSIADLIKSAKKVAKSEKPSAPKESLSSSDAYAFPLIGSCVLFSLYIIFKIFEKEYVNYLLSAYFSIVGVAALAKFLSDRTNFIATWLKLDEFSLNATKGKEEIFALTFTYVSFVMLFVAIVMSIFYVITKNWILSNCFGFAFATNGISLMQMDSFKTGMILLSGLFVYDIFWVFGTEVMVSVAKNFDAPIKMLWPKSFDYLNASPKQMTMLGLGDIVIPGIYVSLCLRYDFQRYLSSLPKKQKPTFEGFLAAPKTFFTVNLMAYIAGLVVTVVVMHTFKAAQPALLYLSPACIISSFLTATATGEVSSFFGFSTETQDDELEIMYGKKPTAKGNAAGASTKASSKDSESTDKVDAETASKRKAKKDQSVEPSQSAAEDSDVATSSATASPKSSVASRKKKSKKSSGLSSQSSQLSDAESEGNKSLPAADDDTDDMVLVVNKKKIRRQMKKQ